MAQHPQLLPGVAILILTMSNTTKREEREMRRIVATALGLAIGVAGAADTALAQQKGEILIGEQCDRTGPTQIVGIRLCAAVLDYINLINQKGGVEGWKIRVDEIDHEYKVP